MAPRTEHVNPGARDGQYLHAHTGAGISKPRSVRGGGNRHARHGRIPKGRVLEHLKIGDEQGDGRNSTGNPHAQHHNTRPANSHASDPDSKPDNPKATATFRRPTTKHTSTTRNLIAIPRSPRRTTDPVKRAFTNANLRAIMAGKPWPKQRKKASAEKMVLKMGIKKEYK